MKKSTFLTLFAIIVIGSTARAQIQQGNVLVGADFANLSFGLNSPNIFNVNLTPKAAWFIKDNIALGGYANFGLQTAKNTSTITTYGIGPLARYYAGDDVSILKHGRFFGEASVGLGGKNVSDGGGNTNGFDFTFGPGFAYFVTPNIGLETLLKYDGLAGFGSQAYQSTLTLNFGLQIYLPGKSTAAKVKGDMR
jgi:hypothetical protein